MTKNFGSLSSGSFADRVVSGDGEGNRRTSALGKRPGPRGPGEFVRGKLGRPPGDPAKLGNAFYYGLKFGNILLNVAVPEYAIAEVVGGFAWSYVIIHIMC